MYTPSFHQAHGCFGSGFCRPLAVLLLLALSTPAAAQPRRTGVASTELSVGAVGARPSGPFREAMGDGYGVGMRSVQRLYALPWLGLRIEGGLVLQEMRRDSLPSPGGTSQRVDMVSSNTMFFAGVGPQVGMTHGPVRPYAHAFAGVHYLVSDAAFEGRAGSSRMEFGGRQFEDAAWAYGGGAGVYVPVRRALSVDLGATWRYGGEATFLTDQIRQVSGDLLTGELVHGRTDMLVVHLGITFGGR